MTKLFRYAFLALLQLVVFFPCRAAEPELNLQQIVNKWTEAMGGKQAIESVKSIQISLNIEEPTYKVNAVYVADRNMHMRIDVYSDKKRVYTESYDGAKGWEMGSDGVAKDSGPTGTAALWHGIVFPGKLFGLHEQEAIGNHLELAGRESVDGINYYVLNFTLKDGFQLQLYVNPKTWLIERKRDFRALHPAMDATKKESEDRESEFKSVDGVMHSFKSIQVELKTGALMQTTTIQDIKMNPILDPAQFKMPS